VLRKRSGTAVIVLFIGIWGWQLHVSALHVGHLRVVTWTFRVAIHCAVVFELVGVVAGERDLVGVLVSVISVLMHVAVVVECVAVYVLILN